MHPRFPQNSLAFNCSILWSHQVCSSGSGNSHLAQTQVTLLIVRVSQGRLRTADLLVRRKSQRLDTGVVLYVATH